MENSSYRSFSYYHLDLDVTFLVSLGDGYLFPTEKLSACLLLHENKIIMNYFLAKASNVKWSRKY